MNDHGNYSNDAHLLRFNALIRYIQSLHTDDLETLPGIALNILQAEPYFSSDCNYGLVNSLVNDERRNNCNRLRVKTFHLTS